MINVAALWRHPIKSHGREALDHVMLVTGQTMPWDRHWAVTRDKTKFSSEAPAWAACRNFMIGTSTPALAGIWARYDEESGTLRLRHADIGTIVFNPDEPEDVARFLDWVRPLSHDRTLQPADLVKVPGRGMTDSDFPSISIMTKASHEAVAQMLGHPLETERWRGNIWLDGVHAWEEMSWVGKSIRIGDAELEVIEPIGRCKHTMANPKTGQRDVDTLAALRAGWGHQDFGVYAVVTKGGKIMLNDKVEVL
ncbi:MAG: MOSC domain-containing protein [Yoonia sp.]|uniref:MOSC domain-containing protein n=1 Tax=Yoonia sp. TaxID=2212373 RepID=UPI003EF0F126